MVELKSVKLTSDGTFSAAVEARGSEHVNYE